MYVFLVPVSETTEVYMGLLIWSIFHLLLAGNSTGVCSNAMNIDIGLRKSVHASRNLRAITHAALVV